MASELFTIGFWEATAARVVNYAAVSALSAWGVGGIGSATGENVSIPGLGVLAAAGAGALLGLLLALAGSQLSPQVAGKIAATLPAPGEVLEVRAVPKTESPHEAS